MKSGIHHIKSKVFEVSFFNAPDGLSFQKEFSDFIKSRITEITEKCLNEFNGSSLQIINRLELDLGDIPYHNYELTFERAYEEELMKQLTNKLLYEGADHVEDADSTDSLLEMIRHFLLKGYMPWNFNSDTWKSFSDLFDHILSKDEAAMIQEMKELLQSDSNRVRLVNQLSERSIVGLVRVVEPSQSEFIIAYHQHWMNTQKKKAIFDDQAAPLSKAFWLFIFNYLFEDRGTFFNTKAFLIGTLHQIANKYNLAYEEVLNLLQSSYKDLKAELSAELSKVIRLITEEEIKKPDKRIEDEEREYETAKDLLYFARNGKWPSDDKIRRSYPEALGYLLEVQLPEVTRMFKTLAKEFKSISRLVEPLDNSGCRHLIRHLSIGNADDIGEYHRVITRANHLNKSVSNTPDQVFSKVIWVLILMTLLADFSSFFNHKSFIRALIRQMANHYNLSYKHLLVELRKGIREIKGTEDQAESLQLVLHIIEGELGEVEDAFAEIQLGSIDQELLEESITSGVIHPFLKKYGFHHLIDLLVCLKEQEPELFNTFISRGLRKSKFKKQFIKDQEQLNTWLNQPKYKEWQSAVALMSTSEFPARFKLSNYRKAITSLILSFAAGNISGYSHFEKELIGLSNEYGLDFNEFVKSLLWMESKTGHPLRELVTKVADKMGITPLSANINDIEEPSESTEEHIELIRMGIKGITNQDQLLRLGFRSLDEMIRHLIKYNKAQLKHCFSHLESRDQPFVGLGRDVSLSTFYSLIQVINESHGRQLVHLLRSMEVKLSNQTQAINRFLSMARSLALYHLSRTFYLEDFLSAFSKLILDTSPDVYVQVIPVLSGKMSTISIPIAGNTNDFISRLEEQLTNPEVVSPIMDVSGLEKIISAEFFEGIAQKESTIIPYFDESTEAIYDEIYIENAGLVLLASYFPTLFEKFSLIEDGKFLSDEKSETAVLLLQHLMMEEPPLNEHHLPLNKILCGLEVDIPIRTDLQLGERDRKMVDGLIEAVIGYWSAIGHSSIEGFQGSWLWRKGKLEHKEDSWELKVEQHSYDMLLDRYPFTISPVKFSWMKKPLIVEWR